MGISFQKTDGPILPKWLWILICTQLFAGSLVKSQCVHCGDFNRIQPQGCAQDITQCGDCLPSYIENPEDPQVCYTLEVVEHPDDEITQVINREVHLVCKFNAKVDCKWSKDGVEVEDIGYWSNRQWMTGSGRNTNDCSLIISRFRADVEGSWVCSSMADSHFQEVSSRPTRLSIALPQPQISFGTGVLNGKTAFYPGKEAMHSIKCHFYSSDETKRTRLWWYLENGQVYRGQTDEWILYLWPELITALDKKLQHQDDKIELFCMAEDESGLMSTARVVFIYDEFQEKPDTIKLYLVSNPGFLDEMLQHRTKIV